MQTNVNEEIVSKMNWMGLYDGIDEWIYTEKDVGVENWIIIIKKFSQCFWFFCLPAGIMLNTQGSVCVPRSLLP